MNLSPSDAALDGMFDASSAVDPRTNRLVGDHGTADQAIEWALDHSADGAWEAHTFLNQWRHGNAADEWPEFYQWLADQEQSA
jgi:hypothetical protein